MVRSFLEKFLPKSEGRLLALCLNNPDNDRYTDKWNKKAVRYLIKELGKEIKLVDELEKSISQQSSKTKCVKVPKNLDRRLLIAHRRGLPQVIYCRLWRWPDLQSHHQIRAISSCESCDDSPPKVVEHPNENPKICINPYHYERIFPKPIDPVLVPCQRIPPDLSTSLEDSDTTGETKARPGNLQLLQFQTGPSHETYRNMVHDFVPPDPNQQYSHQGAQQGPQQAQQHQHPQLIQQIHPQQQPQQLPLQHHQHSPQQLLQQHQQHSPQQLLQQHQQHSPQQIPLQHQQHSPQQLIQQQHQQHSPQQHLQQQFYPQHYGSPPTAEFQDVSPHQHEHEHQQQQQQQLQQQQQQQFMHSQEPALQQQHQIPYAPPQGPSYQQHQEQYHLPQPGPQYQPHYRPTSPLQSPGTLASRPQFHQLSGPMATEPARPYQFKNFKFGRGIQRAPGISVRHPYHHPDPHACVTSPFTYSAQPSSQLQISYQPYQITNPTEVQMDLSHQQAQQQQQPMSTAVYTNEDQPMQYQTTPYIYPTSEQQFQQSTDAEMQITYQDQQPTPTRRQRILEVPYYEPRPSTAKEGEPMQQQPIMIDIREVPYQEGQYWCSISYHEYDQRIGEKYHSNCKIVCVDGYTQPMCNDRFCIGGISNINRNQFTEWVRRRIGRGVRLNYVDGDIYVDGLSESSIFVSNPLMMDQTDDKAIDTVSKLTSGATTKVFSTSEFSELLAVAVTRGFESVYKLTNCCVVRVSFVKGWGRNYKRQSIFNTPCWVEVQLNGPLQWIDKVLRQMRPPIGGCGSTS